MADEQQMLRLLAVANYRLWQATLVGNPAPYVVKLRETLEHPGIGDLVMEVTTMWDPQQDTERFGRLTASRNEVVPYADEEEAELNDHEVLRDDFVYIEGFDGQTHRWSNCNFIRVFESLGDITDSERR